MPCATAKIRRGRGRRRRRMRLRNPARLVKQKTVLLDELAERDDWPFDYVENDDASHGLPRLNDGGLRLRKELENKQVTMTERLRRKMIADVCEDESTVSRAHAEDIVAQMIKAFNITVVPNA